MLLSAAPRSNLAYLGLFSYNLRMKYTHYHKDGSVWTKGEMKNGKIVKKTKFK